MCETHIQCRIGTRELKLLPQGLMWRSVRMEGQKPPQPHPAQSFIHSPHKHVLTGHHHHRESPLPQELPLPPPLAHTTRNKTITELLINLPPPQIDRRSTLRGYVPTAGVKADKPGAFAGKSTARRGGSWTSKRSVRSSRRMPYALRPESHLIAV